MPAMAGDWPRDPRAYPLPQPTEPPAPVRTLPSVAELLSSSSRPSANCSVPAYHHHDYHHARSTPPTASLPPTTANSNSNSNSNSNPNSNSNSNPNPNSNSNSNPNPNSNSNSNPNPNPNPSANTMAPSYWNPVNHHPTSPPVSPTEQRPLSTSTLTTSTPTPTPRVYQETQFRRQQVSKPDAAIQHSALSSGIRSAPHSSATQARQDSAIDQHRFEPANDAQLSKSNVAYSHPSPNDGHRQPSTALNAYQTDPPTSAYAPASASPQSETPPNHVRVQHPARQHSEAMSSGLPYSPSPRSHDHSTERTIAVDIKNGTDPRLNNTGPSSLPEPFYGHQNSNGTRQQRYNVRFAANYTSENMPPSQKSRNDPLAPNAASATVAQPEQPRSSPVLVTKTEESLTLTTNGSTHLVEPQPRATRDTRDTRDTREIRDRGDREPSVERCSGCNEAWRRPIPDLDSCHISPAETNEEFRQIASNMIERLRKQNKMAEAAYDEWKWRHSRCNYRPASPFSTGSVDDAPRRTEAGSHTEESTNGTTDRKRKSEIPHEPHAASKQQRVTDTSPAPPVRRLESS